MGWVTIPTSIDVSAAIDKTTQRTALSSLGNELREKQLLDSLVFMQSAQSGFNGVALEEELKHGHFKAYWDNEVSHLVQTWFSWMTEEGGQ